MADELKAALKSALDKLDALGPVASLNTEQVTQYNTILAEAEGLKSRIDAAKKVADLKEWGEKSAGAAVASTFDRQAIPGEGEIPGVTADPHSGELLAIEGAFKGIGEKNLSLLKSSAYKSAFAEFIRGEGTKNAARAAAAMKVMNEGQWTAGEAWLPPDFRAELIKRIAAAVTVRKNASVYVTGTNGITFPQANYTTDDLYSSGVRFEWQGAGAQTADISEATNPIAGQINIPTHLATACIILQRSQLEDNSFDILGYLSELGAEAFSLGEEDAYTNGDGNGKPQGFMVHPTAAIAQGATATVAGVVYSGGLLTATSDITWDAIQNVEAAMPPQYEAGAKWYANKNTYSRIRKINAGTATMPQWSLGDQWPNFGNTYQPSLLGYGTEKNQFMPSVTIGSIKVPLALINMKGYYIVDRVGLSVEVNPYVLQRRDQVLIYMRKRTGGQLVRYWQAKFLTTTA